MTASEYLSRKQLCGDPKERFSMYLGKPLKSVYSQRSCACGGMIKQLNDGKAVCSNPHCSVVFNDGGNTEGLVLIEKIYSDGKRETAPPPGYKLTHMPKSFIKACKAAQTG